MLRPALLLCAVATLIIPSRSLELWPNSAPKKTVAILYFDNYTGSSDNDPLGKGISSMMISDLSVVQEIQFVERDRMQDLLKEQELQHTKYFDSTTAVKTGRLIGAQYVVVGSFATVNPQMRIDTRVVRVETGEVVKSAQVTGDADKFFDLEQALSNKLIDGLGLALSPEEKSQVAAQQKANRIDKVSTMTSYSQALALFDEKDYSGALVKMGPAVAASPNSLLLRVAYSDMKKRAGNSAAAMAKDKIKSGIGGLLRRPPE
jgi:curli biogenesis system outer membrane secretion channel CsgG